MDRIYFGNTTRQWYGNASSEVRRSINQFNAMRTGSASPSSPHKTELYRSDKYIYYSDGSKQRW